MSADTHQIPYGYCYCGCGQKTRILTKTDKRHGYVKGEPVRYIQGHQGKQFGLSVPPNPSGLCMCGCGQTTAISKRDRLTVGYVKGESLCYINGHSGQRRAIGIDKQCTKCKEIKSPSAFGVGRRSSDGLKCWCKKCVRVSGQARRARNGQRILEGERARYSKLRAENPLQLRERLKRSKEKYRAANRQKMRARRSVKHAVAIGVLPRSKECLCAQCGAMAAEYHHPDYSKHLEVIALCVTCHHALHLLESRAAQ